MSPQHASRKARISNDLGIHLRAAGVLVRVAEHFQSEIWVRREGMSANGKSIMSVLSLAAAKGTELLIEAEGPDAQEAVDAITELISNRFEVK